MDADDNIDDILRLECQIQGGQPGCAAPRFGQQIILTWWRSKNGTQPWQRWKEYIFKFDNLPEEAVPEFGFVGRFGIPGGGTLVIDTSRLGHFYSEAQLRRGALPEWTSLFPY
jgi:hypothetical protein